MYQGLAMSQLADAVLGHHEDCVPPPRAAGVGKTWVWADPQWVEILSRRVMPLHLQRWRTAHSTGAVQYQQLAACRTLERRGRFGPKVVQTVVAATWHEWEGRGEGRWSARQSLPPAATMGGRR